MTITHPSQIHDQFLAAINARDLDALLALYDTSGIAVELDGAERNGREAMRTMFGGLIAGVRHMRGGTRKVFIAGDVALTSAEWSGEFVGEDGTAVTLSGTTAELSRRQPDGTWLVVIDDPMFG